MNWDIIEHTNKYVASSPISNVHNIVMLIEDNHGYIQDMQFVIQMIQRW